MCISMFIGLFEPCPFFTQQVKFRFFLRFVLSTYKFLFTYLSVFTCQQMLLGPLLMTDSQEFLNPILCTNYQPFKGMTSLLFKARGLVELTVTKQYLLQVLLYYQRFQYQARQGTTVNTYVGLVVRPSLSIRRLDPCIKRYCSCIHYTVTNPSVSRKQAVFVYRVLFSTYRSLFFNYTGINSFCQCYLVDHFITKATTIVKGFFHNSFIKTVGH
eukprot:TRINITY_DN5769_c0_g1_i1.p1 TRINITY_DN5769_c0_g1~~TRINITY_DN5769_c0_g1_i1.p1  ORF type:complete len:214 (-),score=-26.92 TRINITY_DN5769_c0_g1_i1:165-806(-)